jgi:hypothetical protein
MLADASRLMYDTSESDEDPGGPKASKRLSPVDYWLATVDTRKMTLAEYKKFLTLQHQPGEGS